MAFLSNSLTLKRRLRGNFSEWDLSSSDDPTTQSAAGYFDSVADRLRVGDLITIYGAGSPQLFAVAGNDGSAVTVTAIPIGSGGGGGGTVNNDDWLGTDLAIVNGGTGASDAATARTNLGLGSLATASTINNANWSGTSLSIPNGGTAGTNATTARSNLGLGALAVLSTVNDAQWSGTDLALANGGTGASDAPTARTNLGLGALATAATVNDANWSGTDLAILNGGTGASDAPTARSNLGLGTVATVNTINNTNWSGTDLALTNGGTGASDAASARINLGISAGSDTVAGILETAVAAEVNAGTDTTLAVSPDALAGSYAGTAAVSLALTSLGSDPVVLGNGRAVFLVTAALNGMNLVSAIAAFQAAGSGAGSSTFQICRRRAGSNTDMLSTLITIASGAISGSGVVDTANDDLLTGDLILVDVDTLSAVPPQGGVVAIEARLP